MIETLLHRTRDVSNKHSELEKARGDRFNIFQVLRLQYNENRTHSALLAELLRPGGDHLKGGIFLKLFLDNLEIVDFDVDYASVTTEHYAGAVDIQALTGGRIDILIRDRNSRTISIENKLYAGDQQRQIDRYCNFNKGKNLVLYLTLDGRRPTDISDGIKEDRDYRCISYADTIRSWLEQCVQVSHDSPILRETIRQYIILINRLTGRPNTAAMKQELSHLLLDNADAAFMIHQNYETVINSFRNEFRDAVERGVAEKIGVEFEVIKGHDISKPYSQLWIVPTGIEKPVIHYGIENFNGRGWFEGRMLYGLYSATPSTLKLPVDLSGLDRGGSWPQYAEILGPDQRPIALNNPEYIKLLHRKGDFRQQVVDCIISAFMIYYHATFRQVLELVKK